MKIAIPQLLGMLAFVLLGLFNDSLRAGMPAPLPTNWTKTSTPSWAPSTETNLPATNSHAARWQAISFFLVCLLLSAWGVQRLWQTVRTEIAWLPPLSYRGSLSLVVLWGLLFIVVLTMISGARELMTPGAWRKQGWTYKLAAASEGTQPVVDSREQRREALTVLRLALWQYAALHNGKFPAKNNSAIDARLWDIAGSPGLTFLLVPNGQAESNGRLLVFEPELAGNERQVLLTNGLIGTMHTTEIQQALSRANELR